MTKMEKFWMLEKKCELVNMGIWKTSRYFTAAEYEIGYPVIDISPWVEVPILYSEKGLL